MTQKQIDVLKEAIMIIAAEVGYSNRINLMFEKAFQPQLNKPDVSDALPPVDDLMQLIEKQCTEHITISGLRFYGTSWAQLVAIFEKFGYERKIPF